LRKQTGPAETHFKTKKNRRSEGCFIFQGRFEGEIIDAEIDRPNPAWCRNQPRPLPGGFHRSRERAAQMRGGQARQAAIAFKNTTTTAYIARLEGRFAPA